MNPSHGQTFQQHWYQSQTKCSFLDLLVDLPAFRILLASFSWTNPSANLDSDRQAPQPCPEPGRRMKSPPCSQPAWQHLQEAAGGWNTARHWWHGDTENLRPAWANLSQQTLLIRQKAKNKDSTGDAQRDCCFHGYPYTRKPTLIELKKKGI